MAKGRRVIRTADDYARALRSKPVPLQYPIPVPLRCAVLTAASTDQPLVMTCDGLRFVVPPAAARDMVEWLLGRTDVRTTAPRGINVYEVMVLLTGLCARGQDLDATLEWVRRRYGISSVAEARRWVNEQRQASVARLRELDAQGITECDRDFHRAIVRWLVPRRPGRPPGRKSYRQTPRKREDFRGR